MRLTDRLRKLSWLARAWIVVGLAFVVLSFDWRAKTDPAPNPVNGFSVQGPLRAGAARVDVTPPFPVPMGGYNDPGDDTRTGVLHPVAARALVVEAGGKSIGLVALEVVVLPAELRRKLVEAARGLGLDDVVVWATHTHAGPGGYWDKQLAEWIGLGAYDTKIEEHLVAGMATALTEARAALRPAGVSWGRLDSNFAKNRARHGAPFDRLLTGVRIDGDDGTPLSRVIVYGSHPTILPPSNRLLSGDWPGATMRVMEGDTGAVVLFAQGAGGDATWNKRDGGLTDQERVVQFGEAFAADARGAIAAAGAPPPGPVALAFSRVAVALPPGSMEGIVWGPFEPLANNITEWLVQPWTTTVSALQLGPARLVFVPGEPVGDLGIAWRKTLGGASVVSLADDYAGYVETPERAEQEIGETFRQYFTPELATRLQDALARAVQGLPGTTEN